MNFLADENIDFQIVQMLRERKHTVLYVAEMDPGISDEEVLDLANQKNAVLITGDRDFGELVFRQRKIMSGVLLIRLSGLSSENKALIVAKTINKHLSELSNAFSVITPGTIRIRGEIGSIEDA